MATARTLYDQQNRAAKTAAQQQLKVGQVCMYNGRVRKFAGQRCTILEFEHGWGGVFVQFKGGAIVKCSPFALGIQRPSRQVGSKQAPSRS